MRTLRAHIAEAALTVPTTEAVLARLLATLAAAPEPCLVLDADRVQLTLGPTPTVVIKGLDTPQDPRSMAPEQWYHHAADARSDVYAVAMLGYHMLLGQPLFDDMEPATICHAHLGAPRPLLTQSASGELVPNRLAHVLLRAASSDAAARYATPQAMAAALSGDTLVNLGASPPKDATWADAPTASNGPTWTDPPGAISPTAPNPRAPQEVVQHFMSDDAHRALNASKTAPVDGPSDKILVSSSLLESSAAPTEDATRRWAIVIALVLLGLAVGVFSILKIQGRS